MVFMVVLSPSENAVLYRPKMWQGICTENYLITCSLHMGFHWKKKIVHGIDGVTEKVIFPCWLKYFYNMVSVFNLRRAYVTWFLHRVHFFESYWA